MVYKDIPADVFTEFNRLTNQGEESYKEFIDGLTDAQCHRIRRDNVFIYDLLLERALEQLSTKLDSLSDAMKFKL